MYKLLVEYLNVIPKLKIVVPVLVLHQIPIMGFPQLKTVTLKLMTVDKVLQLFIKPMDLLCQLAIQGLKIAGKVTPTVMDNPLQQAAIRDFKTAVEIMETLSNTHMII